QRSRAADRKERPTLRRYRHRADRLDTRRAAPRGFNFFGRHGRKLPHLLLRGQEGASLHGDGKEDRGEAKASPLLKQASPLLRKRARMDATNLALIPRVVRDKLDRAAVKIHLAEWQA